MAQITAQKQTARNVVLSANSQTSYGEVLADAALTQRVSLDPSCVFSPDAKRYNDQGAIGHGTDFATVDVITAWSTSASVKGMGGVSAWLLGWMLAFTCGQEVVTGSTAPYTHTFSIPTISSLMPATTVYVEDTAAVHRKYNDMAAKSLSIDIPERGPIQATLDMVGTGAFDAVSMTTLPAVAAPIILLGSDVQLGITPSGGAATSFAGRQVGISLKIDRGSEAFEASGDGLIAGSVQSGKLAFSLDLTVMALETDDVNGWFESATPLAVTLATNTANTYQFGISFPLARFKTRKLGNQKDLVAWQLSMDQGTILQNGSTAAFTAFIINTAAAYLVPA